MVRHIRIQYYGKSGIVQAVNNDNAKNPNRTKTRIGINKIQ